MHAPTSAHMTAAKRILRYLSSTKSHGVVLRASTSMNLRVFTYLDRADVFTKSFSGPKFKQAIANLCRLQSPTGRD
ncbi:hypothetical protein LIER_22590 [Lithospermum erythrorhizon]|uniref:Uncharacterized protein n=1 Tax=Lithospermum erythrorhizon TaxID=34254 RepID=A0AAV3QYM3_LITER